MNQEEFNVRVYPFYNMSLCVATAILKDEEEAKNTVQDVFETLWIERDKLQEPKQICSYVYSTTQRKSFNKLKKAKYTLRFLDQFRFAQDNNVENQFEPSERYLMIMKVVSELPPTLAQFFRLRCIEGYDYKEIAEMLGKNVVTVRMGHSRARHLIIEELKKLNIYENN